MKPKKQYYFVNIEDFSIFELFSDIGNFSGPVIEDKFTKVIQDAQERLIKGIVENVAPESREFALWAAVPELKELLVNTFEAIMDIPVEEQAEYLQIK